MDQENALTTGARVAWWFRAAAIVVFLGAVVGALHRLVGQLPHPHCGTERWPVKTLVDPGARSIDPVPVPTTVRALRAIPRPATVAASRITPIETHVYTVRAVLLGWKHEADEDLHVVLADSADTSLTMIAEIVSPACAVRKDDDIWRDFMAVRALALERLGTPTTAFKRFTPPPIVWITGVGFFDFLHGQTGVAPNGIELHPVLGITFADSAR